MSSSSSYKHLNKPFANDEEKCYVLRRLRRRRRRNHDPSAPTLAERILRERRKEAEIDPDSNHVSVLIINTIYSIYHVNKMKDIFHEETYIALSLYMSV